MSIENVISKMHDVDKLKLVLLDEKQRKTFEMMPKLGVGTPKQVEDSRILAESLKRSIMKTTKITFSSPDPNVEFYKENIGKLTILS